MELNVHAPLREPWKLWVMCRAISKVQRFIATTFAWRKGERAIERSLVLSCWTEIRPNIYWLDSWVPLGLMNIRVGKGDWKLIVICAIRFQTAGPFAEIIVGGCERQCGNLCRFNLQNWPFHELHADFVAIPIFRLASFRNMSQLLCARKKPHNLRRNPMGTRVWQSEPAHITGLQHGLCFFLFLFLFFFRGIF